MRRHLFMIAALAALTAVVSCNKDNKKGDTIDRAVVHCKLNYDFSVSAEGKTMTYSTSFDCLDVKAVCTVNGTEVANEAVSASSKTWSKNVEITSTSTVEIKPVYTLKKEFETNLPERLTAACICESETIGTTTYAYITVDYYSGNNLMKTDKFSISDIYVGSGYKAKEKGLDETKTYLNRQSERNTYSIKVTL